MNKDIVHIDLFSGIGGMHLGLVNAGFKFNHHYFSEIDKHAIANYKYNFPNANYIGSVTDVSGHEIRSKHPNAKIIVTFGFPCQDLSIAGKRIGFKGKRSSLFYHAARVCRETQSDIFIWENVQGLLSANNGVDIESVFEEMYLSGYVFDVEELNTAWVLPQNRVRIYSVGHNIKYLQKCLINQDGQNQNYNICVKIGEGILLTRYPQYLTEVLSLSEQKRKDLELGYLKIREQDQYNGQNLKNKFLKIILELQLNELQNLFQHIQSLLLKQNEQSLNTSIKHYLNTLLLDIKLLGTKKCKTEKEKCDMNIEKLLNLLSEDHLIILSKCIILTLINKTTTSEIYSYAEMQRNIELCIIHLTLLYPNCWNEALSNLIEKKKNINYATKNRGNKGTVTQEDDSNDIQLPVTNEQGNEAIRHLGSRGKQGVLFITENDCGAIEGSGNATTVRTLTGGGHSGGMHSSMTLLRV